MSTILRDLRFATRLLVRDPSFTITAFLTLAICIAANTARLSVVRSVLMKPLPSLGSYRIVLLYNSYPNAGAPRVGNAVRRRELGVRMALGGSGASVFGLVLSDGVKVVAAGLTAGLVGSFFLGQVMKSQLYNVAPMSPAVLGLVSLTLAVVALLAVSIPALRASRINPVVVLGK